MRVFRLQRLRGRFSRRDGDGGGGVRSAAAHVVNRIADDHYLTSAEAMTAELFRAGDGDRRQLLAMWRVAAERAKRKIFVERRAAQLEPRATFDIAGEQSESDARVVAKRIKNAAHARQLAYARPLTLLERSNGFLPQRRLARV